MTAPACPLGVRCEVCGVEETALAVLIVDSPLGELCVTACQPCTAAIGRGSPLPITVSTAAKLADQHRSHCEVLPA